MSDSLVFLSVQDVLLLHQRAIARFGGAAKVRDFRLLQAAVSAPQAGHVGGYFLEDVFEMAAAYLFHVVKNHPFVDGNKRTAALAMLAFLKLNGTDTTISNDELFELVMSVATGKRSRTVVAQALRKYANR